MRWQFWRRSENVEDDTDNSVPAMDSSPRAELSLSDVLRLDDSELARDLGRDDVGSNTGGSEAADYEAEKKA